METIFEKIVEKKPVRLVSLDGEMSFNISNASEEEVDARKKQIREYEETAKAVAFAKIRDCFKFGSIVIPSEVNSSGEKTVHLSLDEELEHYLGFYEGSTCKIFTPKTKEDIDSFNLWRNLTERNKELTARLEKMKVGETYLVYINDEGDWVAVYTIEDMQEVFEKEIKWLKTIFDLSKNPGNYKHTKDGIVKNND